MIGKLKNYFLSNLVLKGSFLILSGSVLVNLGTYLFHLFSGRFLGPADYGILESLISLTYFLSIPITVLTFLVTKFVSQNIRDKKRIVSFIKTLSLSLGKWGLGFLLIFCLFFPWLKSFLKVDSFFPFFAIGIIGYLGIFSAICSASLQGIMEFFPLSLVNIFGSWSKLLLAVLLISLGLKVDGAMMAIFLSSFFSISVGYFFLKRKLPVTVEGKVSLEGSFKEIKAYALTVFVSNLTLTSLYTVDILLARYFLPAVEAGQYAALSVLGKIVFFASSPVSLVMFPIVSSRQAEGKEYRKVILFSLGLVSLISLSVLAVYFAFPRLMISLLFGQSYLGAADKLGIFALFIGLYSLISLLVNFFLSVFQPRILPLLGIASVAQVVLIFFYHAGIRQILEVNILIASLLLSGLLLFFFKTNFPKVSKKPALQS